MSQASTTGQPDASPSRPTSTITVRPRTGPQRSTEVANRDQPPLASNPAWAGPCSPASTHASPASGSDRACSGRTVGGVDRGQVPGRDQPGQQPGVGAGPARAAGRGRRRRRRGRRRPAAPAPGPARVSAFATVVAPGAALPATTAIAVTGPLLPAAAPRSARRSRRCGPARPRRCPGRAGRPPHPRWPGPGRRRTPRSPGPAAPWPAPGRPGSCGSAGAGTASTCWPGAEALLRALAQLQPHRHQLLPGRQHRGVADLAGAEQRTRGQVGQRGLAQQRPVLRVHHRHLRARPPRRRWSDPPPTRWRPSSRPGPAPPRWCGRSTAGSRTAAPAPPSSTSTATATSHRVCSCRGAAATFGAGAGRGPGDAGDPPQRVGPVDVATGAVLAASTRTHLGFLSLPSLPALSG